MRAGDTGQPRPGPGRWALDEYIVSERPASRSTPYVVRGPDQAIVAHVRVDRHADEVVFEDGPKKEPEVLFRLAARPHEQWAGRFVVLDGTSERILGEVRVHRYVPEGRLEWFVHGADGQQLGLVTESTSRWGRLATFRLTRGLFPQNLEVHWGQQVCGKVRRRAGAVLGASTRVDLGLDRDGVIDRRLLLGTVYLVEEGENALASATD